MIADGPTIVTGATGFAGSHLIDRLIESGSGAIHAWGGPDGRPPTRDHPNVTWQVVDLLQRDEVAKAIEALKPACIYHLAGIPHVGESWQKSLGPLRVHVLSTHYLIDAVHRFAPRCRVLVVSSGLIYRNTAAPMTEESPLGPSSPYALSKLAQDQLALDRAHQDGLDILVARPFNHTGPRQEPLFAIPSFARQIAQIERGDAPPELRVGNLETSRDLTDVRDVAAAY